MQVFCILFFFVHRAVHNTADAEQFSKPSQVYFVALHNQFRSDLLPKNSSNMYKIEWNEQVAQSAQKWAHYLANDGKCRLKHGGSNFGQNLYMTSGTRSQTQSELKFEDRIIKGSMTGWGLEEMADTLNRNPSVFNTGQHQDHYSQIVWAKTTSVGCAYATCGGNRGVTVVCEYFPPGNYIGQQWFKEGPSCSQCRVGDVCDEKGLFCVPANYKIPSTFDASTASSVSVTLLLVGTVLLAALGI